MICKKCHKEAPDGLYCALCGFRQDTQKNTKKRGNGQGTAYKRGRTWTGVKPGYSYVEDGKLIRRRQTKGGFATKREALVWAYAGEEETPPPKLIDLWEGYSKNDMKKLSKNRQTAYKKARERLEPIIGRQIDSLTVDDLQRCVNQSCSSFYPARDMKNVLSHLYKRAMASNANKGRITQNLSDFLVLPDLEEKEAVPFTEDELKKLWKSYDSGNSFLAYVLLMCYTGMMTGELLQCKKSMVDLEACEIRGAGLKTEVRHKSSITFPEFIKPVVEAILSNDTKAKLISINKDNFYTEFYEALERAGIENSDHRLTPYSCRHTYGTEAVKMNLHPAVIQKMLRHSSTKTQEKYTHLSSSDTHDAVNQFAKPS